jgi:hypothetical protein
LVVELYEQLLEIFYFVENVFLSSIVLLSTERRRMLQIDLAIVAIEIWHFYLNYRHFSIKSKYLFYKNGIKARGVQALKSSNGSYDLSLQHG